MNNKAKGEISEAKILSEFIRLGIPVAIPFGNNQRYDLLIEINDRIYKVQCKTARKVGDSILSIPTCSKSGMSNIRRNYKGQVDFIAAYSPDLEKYYLIKAEDCPVTNVSLRFKDGLMKYITSRNATDYELEKVIHSYLA